MPEGESLAGNFAQLCSLRETPALPSKIACPLPLPLGALPLKPQIINKQICSGLTTFTSFRNCSAGLGRAHERRQNLKRFT